MPISLGKIYGIPIALDYSWFIIFALIAWTVGFDLMPQTYPGLSNIQYLLIGVLSSILLFVSVLVHELAHSIVAKRNSLKINRITLFLFGGVSEMAEEPNNPVLELKMSSAGPLTSIVIAVVVGLVWYVSALTHVSPLIQAPLQYTMLVNAVVAGFNLIPAFPMDGGRIFRAFLWRRNKDLLRSTRVASDVGRGFAYAIMALGIAFMFFIDLFTGLWLLLIGWFISSGAQSALSQTIVQQDLAGLRAVDMMARNPDSVSPDITLEELSQEFVRYKHNGFPVMSQGELVGCVTVDDLRRVRKEYWSTAKTSQVMTPKDKLIVVKENEQASKVLDLMNRNRIGRVFVLDWQSKLSGIITRSDVLRTVQMQEMIHGRQRGVSPEFGRTIVVDKGMLFLLEEPIDETVQDWTPVYDSNEVRLIEEKISKSPDGKTFKQFSFEAVKSGKHKVRLEARKLPAAVPEARGSVQVADYTVIVS